MRTGRGGGGGEDGDGRDGGGAGVNELEVGDAVQVGDGDTSTIGRKNLRFRKSTLPLGNFTK